jgi:hypothetical protein
LSYWDILNGIFFIQMCIKYSIGKDNTISSSASVNGRILTGGYSSMDQHLYANYGYYGGHQDRMMQSQFGIFGLGEEQSSLQKFYVVFCDVCTFLFGNLDMRGDAMT